METLGYFIRWRGVRAEIAKKFKSQLDEEGVKSEIMNEYTKPETTYSITVSFGTTNIGAVFMPQVFGKNAALSTAGESRLMAAEFYESHQHSIENVVPEMFAYVGEEGDFGWEEAARIIDNKIYYVREHAAPSSRYRIRVTNKLFRRGSKVGELGWYYYGKYKKDHYIVLDRNPKRKIRDFCWFWVEKMTGKPLTIEE